MFLSYLLYPFFLALGFANGRWASAEALRKSKARVSIAFHIFGFVFSLCLTRLQLKVLLEQVEIDGPPMVHVPTRRAARDF